MINRKNTSDVVSTWRDYLNGKQNKTNRRSLHESVDAERNKNEYFQALFDNLIECGWSEDRADILLDILRSSSASNDQLEILAYGSDGDDPSSPSSFINLDDDYDSQEYYEDFPTGSGE